MTWRGVAVGIPILLLAGCWNPFRSVKGAVGEAVDDITKDATPFVVEPGTPEAIFAPLIEWGYRLGAGLFMLSVVVVVFGVVIGFLNPGIGAVFNKTRSVAAAVGAAGLALCLSAALLDFVPTLLRFAVWVVGICLGLAVLAAVAIGWIHRKAFIRWIEPRINYDIDGGGIGLSPKDDGPSPQGQGDDGQDIG